MFFRAASIVRLSQLHDLPRNVSVHNRNEIHCQSRRVSSKGKRLCTEGTDLSKQYELAFQHFMAFALEEPTLQRCGEVSSLWRMRCWDNEQKIGLMDDPYEARMLEKMLEKLTGLQG